MVCTSTYHNCINPNIIIIIIIMVIDGDMMEKLPNNPPHFSRPWRTSVRMVGEVAGLKLNGLE
jgi:hypothetical protein